MKYDIFISYRRSEGRQAARMLKESLVKKGFKVFLDLDELKEGHFMEAIFEALDESCHFMLLMTPDIFRGSDEEGNNVGKEIQYALQKDKNIIPVVLDKKFPDFPDNLPEDIRTGISSIQYSFVDTEHLFNESLDKLVSERIGRKKHRHKKRSRFGILAIIISVFAIYVLISWGPAIYRALADPDTLVSKASSLAGVVTEPKPVAQVINENGKLKSRRIFNLYKCGAEGCEKIAESCYDIFNQSHDCDYALGAMQYYHNSAFAYQCLENYDKAIENYRKSISCAKVAETLSDDEVFKSTVVYSMNNMAYSYAGNKDFNSALNTIENAIELSPADANLYDSKGELLYLAGRYSEAINVWKQIREINPYMDPNYWVDECKEKSDN